MDAISNNALPEPSPVKRRRRHSPAFRAEVLAACAEPGTSVAAVAQHYQLNANLVHKWRKAVDDGAPQLPESSGFIPVPLARSAVDPGTDTRVTFIVGQLTMQWPLSHINQAIPWLKALQS